MSMPSSLTIFAAQSLVYIDAAVALGLLLWLAWGRPRAQILHWVIAVGIMLAVGYAAAQIGGAIYNDPRPFTQDHVKPLIAHAADNGFPSDHALLAAAIAAAALLLDPIWSVPFVIAAVLVDWARVGAGIHHVQDVAGSSVLVLAATIVALIAAPPLARRVAALLPEALLRSPERTSVRGPDVERGMMRRE
jgi:undecaprenyl-diphosphatase